MVISGVTTQKEDGYVVCYVDKLSDELKELIREEISAICYGKQEVEEDDLEHYSYKKTLSEFLRRYQTKNPDMKKGILGEFIAHLIVSNVLENLQTISIFFNKEEQSIKKGFDLNYFDVDGTTIWYGEVKSGEVPQEAQPDRKNSVLLEEAKKSLRSHLTGQRPSLWQSVIYDTKASLSAVESKKVSDLLKMDISKIQEGSKTKKNAILISVLFHNIENKISPERVRQYLDGVIEEGVFEEVILFSIQKSTYQRIEEFLFSELNSND